MGNGVDFGAHAQETSPYTILVKVMTAKSAQLTLISQELKADCNTFSSASVRTKRSQTTMPQEGNQQK
eukprot:4194887-Amphidinium_carterae.1